MTAVEGNGHIDADVPIRQLRSNEVPEVLLERSQDETVQLRLTGDASMLGEPAKAVMGRALEGDLTAHVFQHALELNAVTSNLDVRDKRWVRTQLAHAPRWSDARWQRINAIFCIGPRAAGRQ